MDDQLELHYSSEAQAIRSGGIDAIRGGARRAKREFKVSLPWETTALFERMKAEGRYSDHWETVCDGCREWVTGIFHITLDKKHLCKQCAAKQGVEIDAPQTAQHGAYNASAKISAHLSQASADLPF